MALKISWIEILPPTKTGKVRAKVTLEDGRVCTVWSDFPNFNDIRAGSSIEGDVKIGTYMGKTQYTIYPLSRPGPHVPRATPPVVPAPERIQERVEKSINKTLDRKEDSFRTSATFRDATILTVEWIKLRGISRDLTDDEIQTKWKEWRNWLDSQYDLPFN